MDQKSAEGTAGFLFLAGFNGAAMQWAIWPVQIWLQWQADVLKAAAPTATDWMKRRSEGTEAARRAPSGSAHATQCRTGVQGAERGDRGWAVCTGGRFSWSTKLTMPTSFAAAS